MVLVSQIYGLLKGDKDNMQLLLKRFLVIIGFIFIFSMCVPPQEGSGNDFAKEKARLDSLRDVRCPRSVSYTHLRAHETDYYLVCRLLL